MFEIILPLTTKMFWKKSYVKTNSQDVTNQSKSLITSWFLSMIGNCPSMWSTSCSHKLTCMKTVALRFIKNRYWSNITLNWNRSKSRGGFDNLKTLLFDFYQLRLSLDISMKSKFIDSQLNRTELNWWHVASFKRIAKRISCN